MEGFVIAIFGCGLMLLAGFVFGMVRTNHEKTLIYSAVLLVISFIGASIGGKVISTLVNSGVHDSSLLFTMFAIIAFTCFFAMPLAFGALVAGFIKSAGNNAR